MSPLTFFAWVCGVSFLAFAIAALVSILARRYLQREIENWRNDERSRS